MKDLSRLESEIENWGIWPVERAKEIIEKYQINEGDVIRIMSGFSPTGFPHFGTVRDIGIGNMVRLACEGMGYDSELIIFSDNTDSFKKAPDDLREVLTDEKEEYLLDQKGKPLFQIENPVSDVGFYLYVLQNMPFIAGLGDRLKHETIKSYSKFMTVNLEELVNFLHIPFTLVYANREYKGGKYDEQIFHALRQASKIKEIFKRHYKKKLKGTFQGRNWENYPYLPACDNCGKISTTNVKEVDLDNMVATYSCELEDLDRGVNSCGYEGEKLINGNNGKLPFSLQWLARWIDWNPEKGIFELKVHFEPFGKELLPLRLVAEDILKEVYGVENGPIPSKPFGMYLDEKGAKLSKSAGVSFTLPKFLSYTPDHNSVLSHLSLHNPQSDMKIFPKKIPKLWENVERERKAWYKDGKPKFWFMANGNPSTIPFEKPIGYEQLLNIIQCLGPDEKVVTEYINGYVNRYFERTKFGRGIFGKFRQALYNNVELTRKVFDLFYNRFKHNVSVERTKDYYTKEMVPKALTLFKREIEPDIEEPTFDHDEKLVLSSFYNLIEGYQIPKNLSFADKESKAYEEFYIDLNNKITDIGVDILSKREGTLSVKEKDKVIKEVRGRTYQIIYRAMLKQPKGAPISSLISVLGKEKILEAIKPHIDYDAAKYLSSSPSQHN